MALFDGAVRAGRFTGLRKWLFVALMTLAGLPLAGLGMILAVVATEAAFFGLYLWLIFTFDWFAAYVCGAFAWLWIYRALRPRWYAHPIGLTACALYCLLAYFDRWERLAILVVAWVASRDDFRDWLGKKLSSARASMTAVQAAMFRREVEALG